MDSGYSEVLKQLNQIEKKVRSNHKILKRLYRAQTLAQIKSLVYFIFIVGISISLFRAIRPYLANLQKLASDADGNLETLKSLTEILP